ncbi:MAG TPA: hypothetical protein VGN14_00540 [Candidatus Elarobacter sp.]
MSEQFSTGASTADSSAGHLAELDLRYESHVAALRDRAAEAQAALNRAAEELADAAASPPHR